MSTVLTAKSLADPSPRLYARTAGFLYLIVIVTSQTLLVKK